MAPLSWILLSSRLPREPSRLRLAVWRRLKRLGAVLLHDALWVLPADAKTREAFEWLAQETEEQGGTAFVWEASSLASDQDGPIVEQFRREADVRYGEIGTSAQAIRDATLKGRRRGTRASPPAPPRLAQALRQLRGLERALRLERRRDYFRSPGRAPAAAAVSAAITELEARRPTTRQKGAAHALGD
ncbi:MAG: Chromate resistance protein ChrB [Gemmatimonadales bacterium]